MKLNKQGNIYTVCYIIVLVVLVGLGLAFASNGLKKRQIANANAEKMHQILSSVRIPAPQKEVANVFKETIVKQLVVNSEGDSIGNDAFEINVSHEATLPDSQRKLPVYIANVNHSYKYIIPIAGNGLWGPIWGYISFESDGTTVYGAYFDHESETPGLGAEIEKPAFVKQFEGKRIFIDESMKPINVLKKGTKPEADEDYVDAISGGTITSKGVASMLQNCLKPYENFLKEISLNKD